MKCTECNQSFKNVEGRKHPRNPSVIICADCALMIEADVEDEAAASAAGLSLSDYYASVRAINESVQRRVGKMAANGGDAKCTTVQGRSNTR